MVEHRERQGLNNLELRTLLMTGQAVSQEQDPTSICRWVVDACSILLEASVTAIALAPQNPKGTREVYGKLGASPISNELVTDLLKLTVEWPVLQGPGGVAVLHRAELPFGLTSEGINSLARVRVGTIFRELGVLMVGMHGFWDPGPRGEFILDTLANQAAVALENARIRREAIEQAETLRALIQASPLAIIALDRDARVQMWNPTAEELLGWSEQEMLGRPYPLVFPDQEDEFGVNGERASQVGPLIDLETRLQNKDGDSVDVGVWTTPVSDGATMVIIADITERKQAEEALREVAVLEERNRLAREIHDTLAQGLTGIIWQLNAAEGIAEGSDDKLVSALTLSRDLAKECLEEARRSVWDLRSPTLESGNLAEAIRNEIQKCEAQGIRTSIAVEGERPGLMDAQCELVVLRVAQEALSNVRRHSQAKRVMVELSFKPTEVLLKVVDDGEGFDPTTQRAGPSSTGGGFGLTGMHERARLVGGRIEIRSAPGMGTRLDIGIPYQPLMEKAPALEMKDLSDNGLQKEVVQGIRVLMVDDHEVVRHGIRSMLEQTEEISVVGEAGDGETAIEQILAIHPDVVLMDIQMPKLDGVETVRKLRQLGIDTPAILLSVYANDEYIFDGLRAGARGYLMKDVGRVELVHAIRTVHEGGSLLQPVIANRLVERMAIDEASGLSERQHEILQLLASGARNQEIADQLFLSLRTVKFHLERLYRKLGVRNRTEAVRVARERSILSG